MYVTKKISNSIISHIESGLGSSGIVIREDSDASFALTVLKPSRRSKWRIGVWVWKTDDKTWQVDMFFQHSWYIDKFKPSCSPYNLRFTVKRANDVDKIVESETRGFINLVRGLRDHSVGCMIEYYWDPTRYGVVRWLLDQFWFYNVKEPISDWWHDAGVVPILYVIAAMYKIRFGGKIDVRIVHTECWYPRYEFTVMYSKDLDLDEIKRIWFEINTKRGADGSLTARNRMLEGELLSFVSVRNVIEGGNYDFYFPLDEESDA